MGLGVSDINEHVVTPSAVGTKYSSYSMASAISLNTDSFQFS
jgi:hypothetical protein